MKIIFTRSLPSAISEELVRQGLTVYEALAISKVIVLAERYPEVHIVVASNVEHERARVIQQHYRTLHLSVGATAAAGIIFHLAQHHSGTVQLLRDADQFIEQFAHLATSNAQDRKR